MSDQRERSILTSGPELCKDYLGQSNYEKAIECLFDSFASKGGKEEAISKIAEFLAREGYQASEVASLLVLLGDILEIKGYPLLGIKALTKAKSLSPASPTIDKKIRHLYLLTGAIAKYQPLLKRGTLDKARLKEALAISLETKKSLEYVLISKLGISKAIIGECLAKYYGVPFKEFDPNHPVPTELLKGLKKAFLLHEHWVPLSWGPEGVEILIDEPSDLRKTGSIRGLIKSPKIRFNVGIKEDIEEFIRIFYNSHHGQAQESIDEMVKSLEVFPEVSLEEEPEHVQEPEFDESNSQVVRFVDQVLLLAFRSGASDIHFEPSITSKKLHVRFRMDGVCREVAQAPLSMAGGVLSRLKIMASLDIAEKRLPQDGKIVFRRKGVPTFELRLATVPTVGGMEDAVLRVLAKAGAMKLEEMGLSEKNLSVLKKIITQPYGLILVVGPTGSGKTTTLHGILGALNQPGVKIWTAEDPVEITQHGLRQVEVKPKIGLDFARVMRAFLRADPDIIMIGEMRDLETASIGIEASLTGHLVLSTLHTNSAPETITRLLDMGLNPLNFSDAFLGVLAQRLVRRLCPKCKEAYHPHGEEFEELVHEYGPEYFVETGINYSKELMLFRPKGCDYCAGSGYKGRIGIHEMMQGTQELKRLIRKQASTEDLFKQAMKDGMRTLKQDGISKVLMGITDMSEIRRVVVT